MRTLAQALAEREFYAHATPPAAPSKREKKRAAAPVKLSLLSGFQAYRVGTGDVLNKKAPATA